jgi:hypothetical protein
MKKNHIFLLLPLIVLSINGIGQQLRTMKNNAYKKGEIITYRVHYGFVDAGTARLEVLNEDKKIGNKDAYHIVGTGKSKGAFDWFFKVRDRYETFIDVDALAPWLFIRRVDEGGYKINQNYVFNHFQKILKIILNHMK